MSAIETTTYAFKGTPGNGTSTYVGIGGDSSLVESIHITWDATFVGNLTIETSNIRGDSLSVTDTTAGNWIRENPSSAVISTTSTDNSTGGATVSAATVTVAGGTAGGCMIHIGNLGSRRGRLKITTTTGGLVTVHTHGKD